MSCVITVGIDGIAVVAVSKLAPAGLVETSEVTAGTAVLAGLVDNLGEVGIVLTGVLPVFFSTPAVEVEGGEYCTAVCTPNENAALAFTSGVGGANPGKGNKVTIISTKTLSLIYVGGERTLRSNITRENDERVYFFDITQLLD